MKMKARNKIMLLALCMAALIAVSVIGTMAYLTSTDKVINTFTVGQVKITLDEKDTDDSTPNAERDKANAYHLLPGHEYEKDPTVHVDAVSEDSWIFVKVENGIANYEADTSNEEGGYKKIADQITTNSWTALEGVNNVYYKKYTKSTTGSDLVVFSEFKIADKANETEGWSDINQKTITVTAYAIQADGFANAAAAWAAFGN